MVLFLEFNYIHAFARLVEGTEDPASESDYLFLAPEILLSASNRLMFKAGLQIPLIQALENIEMEAGTRFVLSTEARF